MFSSLNKKIIFAIVSFFIICFAIFGYTLYTLYNSRLQEDQLYLHVKNQQYNELLYHFNKIKSGTEQLSDNPEQETFSYLPQGSVDKEGNRYKNLKTNLYMVLACLTFFAAMIILMIVFMHSLILLPVYYFRQINQAVQQGIYKQRLQLPPRLFHDELNDLEQTYNKMLDSIEAHIQETKKQKEFLQNIIDGIPDAIRVLNFSGNIILTNKVYRDTLEQIAHSESKCTKCYTSLLRRQIPCTSSMSHCPLQELKEQNNLKFIQQLPFGKKQYLSVNASRIDTLDQPLIIESFRDLSNDIRFSHQQKISSLGFLTTALAHEIKNSLGSMRLILENILNTKMTVANKQKYSQLLYNQLIECIKIPERLLKIAKANPSETQQINCVETINEVCSLLDYEATHNGIKVQVEAEGEIPPLMGNETDFKMIFLNLAQNAIKVMPQGGNLTFQISATPKYINIKVTDTGKGIEPENLTHIFEPFFSKDTSEEHIGLGLPIVKSLLHTFGGDIKASSEIGKGTCFRLKIPHKNKK